MNSNSSELTLDSICLKITDGSHFSPKSAKNGFPMLSVKDMTEYGFDFKKCKKISSEDYEKLIQSGCKPNRHDVVIAKDGSILKHVFEVKEELDAVLLSSIAILRPNPKICYPQYLVYFLLNPITKNYILSNYKSGTGVPRIVLKDFKKISINLPSISQQKIVANILSSLDDKIELNKKINQTLESIAQAMFNSWFVDFDPVHAKANANSEDEYDAIAKELGISREILDLFPSEFEESELGLIPKGWSLKKIGEIVDVFDYVANGSFAALKENVNTYDHHNYALYIRTTDFNNQFSGNLKYTDKKSYDFLKKSKLLGFETIISNVGDVGTVFRPPVWLDLPMTLGSNAVGLKGVENRYLDSFLYYFFKSHNGQAIIDQITTGSAQMKFNKTNLRQSFCLLPTEGILSYFHSSEHQCYQKIVNNNKENSLLERIKNILLPKLMSGEIDVSNLNLEPEND